MKTRTASKFFLVLSITAVLALAARNVSAQASTTGAAQAVPIQLSYGVSQIIQLSQANVSEGTIVNYIQNSGNSYGLDANQIVYLKQQGVSDNVINTMLNQRLEAVPAAPQQNYAVAYTAPVATVIAQPVVTCVQPTPACVPVSTVYVIPDTQAYRHNSGYYNSYCGYYPCYSPYTYYNSGYPAVSLSVGFRSGNWGGYVRTGYRAGYHGGWHR